MSSETVPSSTENDLFETGVTPSDKRPTIPKGSQDWTEAVHHENEEPKAKSTVTVGKSQSKKNKALKRKANSSEPEKTPEEEEREQVEENVRKLLLLSSRPTSEKIVSDIIERTQRIPKEPKKPKEEASAFTEADFDSFKKEYFGKKSTK